ncbi:MAG TPA: hypothetical protein VLH08_06855 [Acidobacteriota bacterium]|nr:hypothetical protein [Acidobacteriota bacterium]
MIRKIILTILFLSLACILNANSTVDQNLLRTIVEHLEKNETLAETYDFYQDTHVKELNKDGSVEKTEKRTYRTIQLEGQRYFELVKFDDKALDSDKKKEEAKNREKFLKAVRKKEKSEDEEDDFKWSDLVDKYQFTQHPAEGDAVYVISFKPRPGKLKERNRTERILNHVAGTLWVSSDYNLIKVEANLLSEVNYGLGIIADVQEMKLNYSQTKLNDVWLPENFNLRYKARIFVKTKIRDIQTKYYNLTKRSETAAASAGKLR